MTGLLVLVQDAAHDGDAADDDEDHQCYDPWRERVRGDRWA